MSEVITGDKKFIEFFEQSGALLNGHFQLTSGKHSAQYMQCALVLQHPEYAEVMCEELAKRYADDNIDVVLGPAIGGIVVSYETARALKVRSVFCERKNGQMQLRRGFDLSPGERVLIVEDVVTTGGSILEAAALVKEFKAEVAGFAMIVDRTNGTVDLKPRYESLLKADIKTYDPQECPLCLSGEELYSPGSRR